jgi:hypothetical protein
MDEPAQPRPATYVSDLIYEGVRQKSPEEATAHIERLRRAYARRGQSFPRPPSDKTDAPVK